MYTNTNIGLIDPEATIGIMRLAVADLQKEKDFYQQVIGLSVLDESGESVLLGTETNPLLRLESRPNGYRDTRSSGLFHIAYLLPSRNDLAMWLDYYLSLGYRLDGVGDHIVSEALYLRDPEGNGIEVYRDRPREEWTYQNGNIVMDTLPIDLNDLLSDKNGSVYEGAPAETRNGHIHLSVANVSGETDFYQNVLGLGFQTGLFSASFLSAGGYHHHLGLNSWQGANTRSPDENRLGLLDYEIVLPNESALEPVLDRLDEHGFETIAGDEGAKKVIDPDGIGVLLTNK